MTEAWTSLGDSQDLAEFGISVATAGDLSGDGLSEILVGARLFDTAQADAGKAYLFCGQ
jgi:hypothetical protein